MTPIVPIQYDTEAIQALAAAASGYLMVRCFASLPVTYTAVATVAMALRLQEEQKPVTLGEIFCKRNIQVLVESSAGVLALYLTDSYIYSLMQGVGVAPTVLIGAVSMLVTKTFLDAVQA